MNPKKYFAAAERGDYTTLSYLVRTFKGARDKKHFEETALMKAARKNHFKCVELLIPYEKTLQNDKGWTALHFACSEGSIESARLLAEHEHGIKNQKGSTALIIAAFTNNYGVISALLEKEAKLQDASGNTALIHAANQASIDCLITLIPYEAGVKNMEGHTALMCAANKGITEAVMWLYPFEYKETDEQGNSIQYYLDKPDSSIDKSIINQEEYVLELARYAMRNDFEKITELLTSKGHLPILSPDEVVELPRACISPLIVAAAYNSLESVKVLIPLQHSFLSHHGNTALMVAACRSCYEAAEALVTYEKRIAHPTTGKTALMCASQRGCHRIVQLLVSQEGRMQDKNGSTALMFAAYSGHHRCVELLAHVEYGISDTNGFTALIISIRSMHEKCAIPLMLYELEHRDNNSLNPLEWAVGTNNTRLTGLIAPLESIKQQIFGISAIEIAKKKGYSDILRILNQPKGLLHFHRAITIGDLPYVCAKMYKYSHMKGPGDISPLERAKLFNQHACAEFIANSLVHPGDLFIHAASTGNMTVINEMSQDYATSQDPHTGRTALMTAASHGHTDIVKHLLPLEYGLRDNDGRTALMYAIQYGQKQCVAWLIPLEYTIRDSYGCAPLDIVRAVRITEIQDMFRTSQQMLEYLKAATLGDVSNVQKWKNEIEATDCKKKVPGNIDANVRARTYGHVSCECIISHICRDTVQRTKIYDGMFATTYRCVAKMDNIPFIDKVYKPQFAIGATEEAKKLSACAPVTPVVLDVYQDNEGHHLCLEDCGESLSQQNVFNTVTSKKEKYIIAAAMLKALLHIHSKDIIHGDLSPGNLLTSNNNIGQIAIIDLGISVQMESYGQTSLVATSVYGTDAYLSPHKLDKRICREGDIFSLASCMYYVFTGKAHFDRLSNIVNRVIPPRENIPNTLFKAMTAMWRETKPPLAILDTLERKIGWRLHLRTPLSIILNPENVEEEVVDETVPTENITTVQNQAEIGESSDSMADVEDFAARSVTEDSEVASSVTVSAQFDPMTGMEKQNNMMHIPFEMNPAPVDIQMSDIPSVPMVMPDTVTSIAWVKTGAGSSISLPSNITTGSQNEDNSMTPPVPSGSETSSS